MSQPIRVELVRTALPADGDAVEVQRGASGWTARINGTAMPLTAFAVEPDSERVLVSLVVAADEVSVRRSLTAPPTPAAVVQEKPATKRGVWGDPNAPDPRENLPGWPPQAIGAQATVNAQAVQR